MINDFLLNLKKKTILIIFFKNLLVIFWKNYKH